MPPTPVHRSASRLPSTTPSGLRSGSSRSPGNVDRRHCRPLPHQPNRGRGHLGTGNPTGYSDNPDHQGRPDDADDLRHRLVQRRRRPCRRACSTQARLSRRGVRPLRAGNVLEPRISTDLFALLQTATERRSDVRPEGVDGADLHRQRGPMTDSIVSEPRSLLPPLRESARNCHPSDPHGWTIMLCPANRSTSRRRSQLPVAQKLLNLPGHGPQRGFSMWPALAP